MYPFTSGEWYLRYTCRRCKSRHVIFPDLSRGKSKIDATYILKCAACNYRTAYEPSDIERYQHPLVVTKAS